MEFRSSLEDGREVNVISEGDVGDVYVAAIFDAETDEEVENISQEDECRLFEEAEQLMLEGMIDQAENLRDQEREG